MGVPVAPPVAVPATPDPEAVPDPEPEPDSVPAGTGATLIGTPALAQRLLAQVMAMLVRALSKHTCCEQSRTP
jgi:hypothetical protein